MEEDRHANGAKSSVLPLVLAVCFVLCCLVLLWCFLRLWMSLIHSENDENACSGDRSSIARLAVICDNLPAFSWRSTDAEEKLEEKARNDKQKKLECVICLSEIEEGEMVRLLSNCGHVFHVECIDPWFCRNFFCPFCRTPITVAHHSPEASSSSCTVSVQISNLC